MAVPPVAAQQAPETTPKPAEARPFLFKARQLDFDRASGIITASGAVEITQGERVLLADKVTYFQKTDNAIAEGNVTLIDPSRNVIFGDRVELTGDFKDGIIEGIRLRLADNSRVAAAGARRTGGFRTEMRKAVYSPCKPCEEDPDRAPLWQIKAIKVVHDEVDKQIEYSDAWLEIYGIPVAYVPYMSHPDPTVKRRTGFLVPSYGNDDLLGAVVRTPFYITFAPNHDATITPIFTSQEGVVLAGEYRHRFTAAELTGAGSITHASTDDGGEDFRGHVFAGFGLDISDNWRSKLNIALTTDDTYLRRYNFNASDTLVNHALVEGFWDRDYAAGNAYFFQGLRVEDDPGQTPIVFPMFDYNYVGDPWVLGSFWTVDSNVLAITRTEGTDSRRLSLKTGWRLPYTSPIGDRYRLFATVQANGYLVDDQQRDADEPNRTFSGFTGRVFPQFGLDWRYPFVRQGKTLSQIIEPVAGIIIAPNVGRQDKVPNEDSLDVELDDTNIFDPNRFTGLDRVEGGHRAYYGLNAGIYGEGSRISSIFIGQSLRLRENSAFGEGSGLDDQLSDIVGRVKLAPIEGINVLYRVRLNTEFDPQRHEVVAELGTKRLNLKAEYIVIEEAAEGDEVEDFDGREELNVEVRARLTENWRVSARTRRDLSRDGGPLFNGATLAYQDDCITVSLDYSRRFFEDRDIQPSDSIFLRISLRTLGEVGTGTSP